jgi:hypothetical protein
MVNLSLNISRFYTDMNGVVLSKLLVPSTMQQKVPFWLFNKFDKDGAFLIGQTIKPVRPGMYYLYNYIVDNQYNFLDFQIGNEIKKLLKSGDMLLVFGDDTILPNTLCLIVVHSDYVAYGSFIAGMQGKNYLLDSIQYFSDNTNNWLECLNITNENDFGVYKDNQLQPIAYKNPYQYQPDMLQMENVNISLSDKTGISSYFLFDTNAIELNFFFKESSIPSPITNNNGSNSSNAVLFRVG